MAPGSHRLSTPQLLIQPASFQALSLKWPRLTCKAPLTALRGSSYVVLFRPTSRGCYVMFYSSGHLQSLGTSTWIRCFLLKQVLCLRCFTSSGLRLSHVLIRAPGASHTTWRPSARGMRDVLLSPGSSLRYLGRSPLGAALHRFPTARRPVSPVLTASLVQTPRVGHSNRPRLCSAGSRNSRGSWKSSSHPWLRAGSLLQRLRVPPSALGPPLFPQATTKTPKTLFVG
jgi:hypothetical protein